MGRTVDELAELRERKEAQARIARCRKRQEHDCPDCGRTVRWGLTYCVACRWQEPNPSWDTYLAGHAT